MKEVNIAKLLKLKNRIAADITRLKLRIGQYNSYSVDPESEIKPPPIDVVDLVNELNTKTANLIAVKSAISRANIKCVEKIYTLAEVKGKIAFLENLNCASGKQTDIYHRQASSMWKRRFQFLIEIRWLQTLLGKLLISKMSLTNSMR